MKSLWLKIVIFFEKIFDQTYRVLVGMPTLKRSQITANLFLGGQYNRRGLLKLRQLGITAIVNMRITSVFREALYQDLRYLHLPTSDQTPPSLQDLEKGADFIETEIKKGGKVYIHCRQGQGRGPSMAIAYLLKIGMTYQDAYDMVQKVRTFINPTSEQRERLQELEKYYSENKQTA